MAELRRDFVVMVISLEALTPSWSVAITLINRDGVLIVLKFDGATKETCEPSPLSVLNTTGTPASCSQAKVTVSLFSSFV